jgi:hypothetical protein
MVLPLFLILNGPSPFTSEIVAFAYGMDNFCLFSKKFNLLSGAPGYFTLSSRSGLLIPPSRAQSKKEPEIYFYGSGLVIGDEGTKLENCVPVSLLKQAFSLEDETGQRTRLD